MRVYLALDAQDLELDLRKLKTNLNKAKNLEHRWVPSGQWHIPLCPIGEMGQSKLQQIDQVISSVLSNHECFELRLEGVWAYPTQDHARLIWVGVQNARELRFMQSVINQELGAHFADGLEEKPFRPHLPIVRLRNHRNLTDIISPFKNTDFGKIKIQSVVMYEMTSGGAFPTYRKLRSYPLQVPGLSEEHILF